MTTTFTYDITHADATRTILTVVDRNGTVAEESRLPAPAAAAPPTPQAPIPPPIDLPVGAGWKASRRILTDAEGTKTTTTSYTIEKDSTRFVQTEVTIGQGETKVTKGAPTPDCGRPDVKLRLIRKGSGLSGSIPGMIPRACGF